MSEATLTAPHSERPPSGRWARDGVPLGVVRLPSFQGTLDLLLHFIRTEEIDITALPIAEIARQYNDDLALVRDPEPEAAGEHVVGVATLIHMKSRRLLPPDPAMGVEAPVSPEEQDTIDRAARAQVLHEAAEHLQEREAVMELVYLRSAGAVSEYSGEGGIDADLFALLRAFQEILRRVGSEATGHISRERITLVERIHWLMERVQRERRVQFRSLFGGLVDRVACILTFLALLEVIRLRLVLARVSHPGEDILIVLAERPPAPEEGMDHA